MTALKRDDRVTSPLLVGTWVFLALNPDGSQARITNGQVFVWVPPAHLTLAEPVLVPKPTVKELAEVGNLSYQTAAYIIDRLWPEGES